MSQHTYIYMSVCESIYIRFIRLACPLAGYETRGFKDKTSRQNEYASRRPIVYVGCSGEARSLKNAAACCWRCLRPDC